MNIEEIFDGVFLMDDHLATLSIDQKKQVYGEKLIEYEDGEFRLWDPRRSKLASCILKGMSTFPFKKNSNILYLGASAGTTPSHLSDICCNGRIYCVEFAPVMMRELVDVCKTRHNLLPILDDATKPLNYLHLVECVDIIYSDVAQSKQTELFLENIKLFADEDTICIIMIKARSIDVTKNPNTIFKEEEHKLKESGMKILEKIKLDPYEKDHIAFICKKSF
ncbi:MAG: fibrillarin-like rRNA/tRNA 2'-O-methyltransferase [Methanobacteriaceae archaeon]|nr:fibrillarin-like rRNA/tRNA 2'-O-methyltransferase [Methanobacteriaceae archaeon]